MATSESRAPGGRLRGHEASDGALPRQVKAAQSLGRGTVRPYSDGMTMLDEARTGTDDATVDFAGLLGERVELVVDGVTRIDAAARRVDLASGAAAPADRPRGAAALRLM